VNREGTLHVVQVSKSTSLPTLDRYQVGFADYKSPGGAMKTREIVGEMALRNFFTSIGVKPMVVESVLRGLRTDGSASVLNVVLPEAALISLGLADRKYQQQFPVRFTVFDEPNGPVLAYCLAGPFMSATFSNRARVRFADIESLIRALDSVGLPGRTIVQMRQLGEAYAVTGSQLTQLGFSPPAW
jgi:hypothetical protein